MSSCSFTPLRGSRWSRKLLSLCFVACFQHPLNQLQHAAVGDLLSDKGQQLLVIHRPEKIFQIRVHDPLVSVLHLTPDLGQGIGGLATFAVPKAARIKDTLKDRLQAVDQCLLTYPVINRRYAERPCLAWSSSFSESPIVAQLAADRCPREALDEAVPDFRPVWLRTPQWSPCLRRLPLDWRERAPRQEASSCVSTPCPPESGPSASDLRGQDGLIVSSTRDVRVFHTGNCPSSRVLLIYRGYPASFRS